MVYVISHEIIPETHRRLNRGALGHDRLVIMIFSMWRSPRLEAFS
jgi:hypothetical protein